MTIPEAIQTLEDYGYMHKATRVLWDDQSDQEAVHYMFDHCIFVGEMELKAFAQMAAERMQNGRL